MSQFQFNMIMLVINAVVAFYFVRIFAKQIVSYEDYEGQFTMMTQYLSAIRTSLQSQEGRSQTAFALMRLYIIPILVACLPSIAHITLVGTSNVTDIISMVIFILLFGSLAWLTSRLITSNRIWLPRRFFNTIVHNLWQEYQKLTSMPEYLMTDMPKEPLTTDQLDVVHDQANQLPDGDDREYLIALLSMYLMHTDLLQAEALMAEDFTHKSDEQRHKEYNRYVRMQHMIVYLTLGILAVQLVLQTVHF